MRRILFFLLLLTTPLLSYSAKPTDREVEKYVREARLRDIEAGEAATELTAMGVAPEELDRILTEIYWPEDLQRPAVQGQSEEGVRLREVPEGTRQRDARPRPFPVRKIFGHDIFDQENLTFEPSMNVATPENYILGPGDEVIIDVWGANETSIRSVISPDGTITVSGVGLVQLNGLSVGEANARLRRELGRIYGGIGGQASNIKLSLGQIRTIQVNILGEVRVPGTYALSSFSTIFNALYRAGGINDIGSLRNVKVVRSNREVAVVDIYGFILNGDMTGFVSLCDGDVIIVPPYEELVEISGKVKRPMFYEMKRGETMADLISYSGGYSAEAYHTDMHLRRFENGQMSVYTIASSGAAAFPLRDGDCVTVGESLDRYSNRVTLRGAVYREGEYETGDAIQSVRQLIERAGGLRGDAFMNRAVIRREKPDMMWEVIPVDLGTVMRGTSPDITLMANDEIYIPSHEEMNEERTVTITGDVARPGLYPYSDNMSIEDMVVLAGGLLESASTVRVDVFRRMRDPRSMIKANEISREYTFSLRDGLAVGPDAGFVLQPYDNVYVRRSPGYSEQKTVEVTGEVLYEGYYSLTHKAERLSDLIAKAGGLTEDAYTAGARVVRIMNEDERAIHDAVLKVAEKGGRDSVSMESLDLSESYNVGIRLDMALDNPGSDYDLILREGDKLIVPEYANTVRVNGEVLYANTVVYRKGKGTRYYISQSGGFTSSAKRKQVYVIQMNGTVSRGLGRKVVQPGCEIIVPSRAERRRLSFPEILNMSTSATSLATMGATIANISK